VRATGYAVITTETMGDIDGTVQVGAAHGAGDWPVR
jgi:hypothetical protein